jgi:hypothetical protein
VAGGYIHQALFFLVHNPEHRAGLQQVRSVASALGPPQQSEGRATLTIGRDMRHKDLEKQRAANRRFRERHPEKVRADARAAQQRYRDRKREALLKRNQSASGSPDGCGEISSHPTHALTLSQDLHRQEPEIDLADRL